MLRMVSCCGKACMVEGAFRRAEKSPRREKKMCVQAIKWVTSAEWLQRERGWRDPQSTTRNRARLRETLAFYASLLQLWTLTSKLFCLSTASFKHFKLKPSGQMNNLPEVTSVYTHTSKSSFFEIWEGLCYSPVSQTCLMWFRWIF